MCIALSFLTAECGPTLRRQLSCLVICLILSLPTATHCPCHASELETELRRGIRAAKVLFENSTLQATVAILNHRDTSKTNTSRFALHNGQYLLETSVDAKTQIETVKGINPRYAFAVAKSPGQPNYSLLKVISKADTDLTARVTTASMAITTDSSLFHGYVVEGWRLWDMIDDPGFKFVSIERLAEGDDTLVKATYQLNPQRPPTTIVDRPAVGYFICKPAAQWAIVELYIKDKDSEPNCLLKTIELGEEIGGLPTSAKVWRSSPNPSPSVFSPERAKHFKPLVHYAMTGSIDTSVLEEVFFLSHYELPEPKFPSVWFKPWLWMSGVGIFVAIVVTYRLRRRRNA